MGRRRGRIEMPAGIPKSQGLLRSTARQRIFSCVCRRRVMTLQSRERIFPENAAFLKSILFTYTFYVNNNPTMKTSPALLRIFPFFSSCVIVVNRFTVKLLRVDSQTDSAVSRLAQFPIHGALRSQYGRYM